MDEAIKTITPDTMSKAMIDIDEFIELYQDGKCEIVDVRMDFEKRVWGLNFGINIPLNELSDRIDELPSGKMIVLICPTGPRSIVAWSYLYSKGYDAVFLKGGLDILTNTLKGGRAKIFLTK